MASSQSPDGSDRSVADVLSSIRQILQNEQPASSLPDEKKHTIESDAPEEDDEVLVLSPAMMDTVPSQDSQKISFAIADDKTRAGQQAGSGSINHEHDSHADGLDGTAGVDVGRGLSSLSLSEHADDNEVLSVTDLRQIELIEKAQNMSGSLPIPLNDETISDTGNSFAVLQKTLQEKYLREHEERKVAITHEGSLTVEDIVRQEVRVFLKKWLDANLASIVQASVRKEVERLTQRGL
ncbi:DUF2497 domain-containing protein [Acetobacter indonesiensis]|uniref:DUF2497 domain-containing protein n=1 Tax=Acetobacter indonesiensis TaxID=104101 RepID=UPI001F22A8B6|nr:DUF2497 domain-containing protein [Acetobacter indonesiensis]MCG0995785.1 DUF2497 domain-containing protein [Acetobacter indonesiensis]